MTPEQQDQIVTWTRHGVPAHLIAERLHVTTRTVQRWRRRLGVSQDPRRWTPQELHTAQTLLADGASYHEVARTLDRAHQEVARKVPGFGWTYKESGAFGQMLRRSS